MTANVENYRAGHEAFNRRDFTAMTQHYAPGISWTDHAQGRTFGTPEEFRTEFLAGWLGVSSDIRISDAGYLDAGGTVVSTFTVSGTQDGPLGPFPPPARSSRCRCARCGTSTPPARSSAATFTTTSSPCSRTSV